MHKWTHISWYLSSVNLYLAVMAADTMGTLSPGFQSAVVGVAAWTGAFLQHRLSQMRTHASKQGSTQGKARTERRNKDLFFSAVTFLAFFQVAIATALPSVHHSGVWHIEETLPTSRAQVALQLLPVALVKHPWKRMTGAR